MRIRTHERVSSIFWVMIGIYVAIHAYKLGLGSFRRPGSGFIFFLAALFLTILSAIDLAETYNRKTKTSKAKDEHPIWRGRQWQKIILVLCVLLAYVFFLNIAGFWVSTFLLMVFLFKGVEPTKWWVAIVSSLITVLCSYVIFKGMLDVQFRKGFIRF